MAAQETPNDDVCLATTADESQNNFRLTLPQARDTILCYESSTCALHENNETASHAARLSNRVEARAHYCRGGVVNFLLPSSVQCFLPIFTA